MILAHQNNGRVVFEEYRTDAGGQRTDLQPSGGEFGLTKGFATLWTHFYSGNRSASTFKLLGTQKLGRRKIWVVAFAQRPGWASSVGRVESNGKSVVILFQGIAWIDPSNYQIMRMRTDLLAPRPDIGLVRQTTKSEFSEVRLAALATPLWLPREVEVTIVWRGELFHNEHRYTNYRLFRVESTILPIAPGQRIPQN